MKEGNKSGKKKLRVHRKLKDLTQDELAHKAGVSSKTISNYERNIKTLRSASYSNLTKIAKALDISVDDIFLG